MNFEILKFLIFKYYGIYISDNSIKIIITILHDKSNTGNINEKLYAKHLTLCLAQGRCPNCVLWVSSSTVTLAFPSIHTPQSFNQMFMLLLLLSLWSSFPTLHPLSGPSHLRLWFQKFIVPVVSETVCRPSISQSVFYFWSLLDILQVPKSKYIHKNGF